MDGTTPLYWPFPVPPLDQLSEEDRKHICFLEAAFAEGFRPSQFLIYEYMLESPAGQIALILYRGHTRRDGPRRWELGLHDQSARVFAFWVDDFDCAAAAALQWVRAGNPAEIPTLVEGHVIRGVAEPVTAVSR